MGDRPAAERAEGRVRASETFKALLDTYMTRPGPALYAAAEAEITESLA
jgi:hypothetical protein